MADRGWMDAALAGEDEDDSSYVSSSASEISDSEISDHEDISEHNAAAVKKAAKIEAAKARAAQAFAEMQSETPSASRPADDDGLYAVFNARFARPAKDVSVEGVLRRIDLETQPKGASEEAEEDYRRFRRREPSEVKRPLSEVLAAVEQEFVEIEEDGIFAGKLVKLKKKVSVYSEEAKRFMKRQKRKPGEQVSALDSYLETMKVKTVNAMDKTTADWSQFKETKGLSEDLEKERKRGYLVDKAFLAKVSKTTS